MEMPLDILRPGLDQRPEPFQIQGKERTRGFFIARKIACHGRHEATCRLQGSAIVWFALPGLVYEPARERAPVERAIGG